MAGQFSPLPASARPGPSAPGASAPQAGVRDSVAGGGGSRAGGGASTAPLKSVYKNPKDLERAQKQTEYELLSKEEKAEQDVWAKAKADEFAPCPYGRVWVRHEYCPGVSFLPPPTPPSS